MNDTITPPNKITMSFDRDYMTMIAVCEKIYDNFFNHDCTDMKMKYTQMRHFPTVEELQAHHVEDHLEEAMPFLVFYTEVFEGDNSAEFQRTYQYITNLIKERVEFVD